MTLYYRTSVRREAPLSRESQFGAWDGFRPRQCRHCAGLSGMGTFARMGTHIPFVLSLYTVPGLDRVRCVTVDKRQVVVHGLLFTGDSKTVSLQYGFVNNSICLPWHGGGVSSINNSNDAMRLTPLTNISDSDDI